MHPTLTRLLARPIAHRGLHACGRPGPVENTRAAAEAAIAAGYGIECDVLLSADGEAMVFHDSTLERLTAASGPFAAQSAATLTALNVGGSDDVIPTLPGFLRTIDGRTPLVIEIKVQAPGDLRLAARTLELVRGHRGPIALESFDPAVVAFLRQQEPPCPIGLVGPAEDGTETTDANLDLCDFVSWQIGRVAQMADRRRTLPRSTWTVRTPTQQAAATAADAQIVFEGFDPESRR